MRIILASNSPRRRRLLILVGVSFDVVPANVDETPLPEETPEGCVMRLACEKARWVGQRTSDESVVIAADTSVVDGNDILGKPGDAAEAREMLQRLRGRTHFVYTAIAVFWPKGQRLLTDCCRTETPMRAYTDNEINDYIATGDPFDKAGAYAIQHAGFRPVETLAGCYANVMGLPLCHLMRILHISDDVLGLARRPAQEVPIACQQTLGFVCGVYPSILPGMSRSDRT